jgi:hypothetical protein
MDENTCLEDHIERMRKAYSNLMNLWDYLISDDIALARVLLSLPPSYKDSVRKTDMQG